MSLVQVGGENLTVSSTALGPTASEVTGKVFMAEFQNKGGGPVFFNEVTTPTAAGVTGDIAMQVGARWRVWGTDAITNCLMIRIHSDANIAVQYFGQGGS